jgi:mono/diheme cytochrome c family protein
VVKGSRRQLAAGLTAGIVCLAVAAGCGGSGSDTVEQQTRASGTPESPSTGQPLSPAEVHGRQLFVQNCGSCHTFAAAGTLGQVGPNLGDIAVDEADVLRAIRIGGGPHAKGQEKGPSGTMPRNLVTGKDAQEVAAFVAANASGSSTP